MEREARRDRKTSVYMRHLAASNQKPVELSMAFIPGDTNERISARSRLVFRLPQYAAVRWFDYVRCTTPAPHPRHHPQQQQRQQQQPASISEVVVTADVLQDAPKTRRLCSSYGGIKNTNMQWRHDESNFNELGAVSFSPKLTVTVVELQDNWNTIIS